MNKWSNGAELSVGNIDTFSSDSTKTYHSSDSFLELRQQLLDRTNELAAKVLTDKQMEVYVYMQKSIYSQAQIGKMLGVRQETISKRINGGTYRNGVNHGGLLKKLRKVCGKDAVCLRLLEEMKKFRGQSDSEDE